MNIQTVSFFNRLTLSLVLLAALGCGSKDAATTAVPSPESSPITAGSGSPQQAVRLGQAITQFQMNQSEMQTIYETENVPATCTRNVQEGTHSECHTENQQQCTTTNQVQCTNVNYPVCQTIPRRVCDSHGVCHTENSQVCHDETRQQCTNVPEQHCTNFPQQVCVQVPTIVQQQYACTQQQQVAVGQQLKLHTLAQVTINLVNPRNLDVTRDQIIVTLNNSQISAVAQSASGIQYQIRMVSRQVQETAPTEEVVYVTLEVTALY